MDDWRIERLDRSHRRGEFRCGKAPLDDFLRSLVSQYEKRNLGRTYVAVREGERKVVGYYTLASGALSFENLPKTLARKLPKHPVPIILLGRLAVDLDFQGKGLGEALLIDALRRCLALGNELGVHAVEVHAIDQQAGAYYERYGFQPLVDNPLHLFLPMTTIKAVLGTP